MNEEDITRLAKLEREVQRLKNTRRNKKSYSKPLIIFIITLNIAFTIAVIHLFLKTGAEPQVLIGSFFGFTTVELWQMARIKQTKIKENRNE